MCPCLAAPPFGSSFDARRRRGGHRHVPCGAALRVSHGAGVLPDTKDLPHVCNGGETQLLEVLVGVKARFFLSSCLRKGSRRNPLS